MSNSWIKMEKSLETDPRILRMAAAFEARYAGALQGCNASALRGVTVVVGAVTRLWMLADSHASEDDTLEMSPAELECWLGVPGILETMPSCWVEVTADNKVKLPRFQEHNGVIAKRNAQAAARQTRYRANMKRNTVTQRDAGASPDRDQDQDQKKKAQAPFDPATVDGLDLSAWAAWVEYRSKGRNKLSPASLPAAAKRIASFGSRQAEAVNLSIANGWTGVFPPDRPPARSQERRAVF